MARKQTIPLMRDLGAALAVFGLWMFCLLTPLHLTSQALHHIGAPAAQSALVFCGTPPGEDGAGAAEALCPAAGVTHASAQVPESPASARPLVLAQAAGQMAPLARDAVPFAPWSLLAAPRGPPIGV